MAKMFDTDASPQDAGFNALRLGISVVAEYGSLAPAEGRLTWAIRDIKSIAHDLADALMADEPRRIRAETWAIMGVIRDTFGDV